MSDTSGSNGNGSAPGLVWMRWRVMRRFVPRSVNGACSRFGIYYHLAQGHRGRTVGMTTPNAAAEFFAKWGFLQVPGAFAEQASLRMQDWMWQRMRSVHGIERDNPQTWQVSWPAAHLTEQQSGLSRRGWRRPPSIPPPTVFSTHMPGDCPTTGAGRCFVPDPGQHSVDHPDRRLALGYRCGHAAGRSPELVHLRGVFAHRTAGRRDPLAGGVTPFAAALFRRPAPRRARQTAEKAPRTVSAVVAVFWLRSRETRPWLRIASPTLWRRRRIMGSPCR